MRKLWHTLALSFALSPLVGDCLIEDKDDDEDEDE